MNRCACMTAEDCDGTCGHHRAKYGKYCNCGCVKVSKMGESIINSDLSERIREIRKAEGRAGAVDPTPPVEVTNCPRPAYATACGVCGKTYYGACHKISANQPTPDPTVSDAVTPDYPEYYCCYTVEEVPA